MKLFRSTLSAVALLALAAPAVNAATLLDDFTTFQRVEDDPSGFPNTDTSPAAEAIGGWRSMSVQTNPSAPGTQAATVFQSGVGDGRLSFSNQDGQTGQGVLIYDANGAGLNADLTFGGTANAFLFEVTSFDLSGAANFTLEVCDTTAACGVYAELLDATFDPKLNFSEIGGVDFESVASLVFTITSTTDSFDGSIGSISVVPLPASALLLLGGLGGLGGISAAKRRRRKA